MKTRAKSAEAAPVRGADFPALQDAVRRLALETAEATLPAKVEQTMRQWFSRMTNDLDESESLEVTALALALAMELESFTPSHTGTTALDRILRQRTLDANEQAAFRALKTAVFTPFVVRRPIGDDVFMAEDLATEREFVLFNDDLPAEAIGVVLIARLCILDADVWGTVGMIMPLDDGGLAVALEFVRAGKGIAHGHRCAASVYKHLVRHGGPKILGLNVLPDTDEADEDTPNVFDVMVAGLVVADTWRDPPRDVLDEVRCLVSSDAILDCLFKAVTARRVGDTQPGMVFRRFAEVMIEALHLRALAGSGRDRTPLESLAAVVDDAQATQGYPRAAADLFRDIRRALSAAQPKESGENLTRVIDRIRGLRAKTVDQGCTEEEALAAADKVAELLDRYGLSLGETDMRQQACLGIGIDSTRKRPGALDDVLAAVAHFCDCRAWQERAADDTIRCVFFGPPAEVEAAQYLYERVAIALETETASFRKGALYTKLVGGGRQKATTSFQLGLVRGIGAKLDARKAARDAKTFQTSGRDLVPIKEKIVEDELAKLGLSFTTKGSGRGRLVHLAAFEQGQVAAGRFEIQSDLEAGDREP